MAYAIFEPGMVAATSDDRRVKDCVSAVAVERANVVALGTINSGDVYNAAAPADVTTDLMALVNEPVLVEVNGWRGLTDDPTLFNIPAGQVYNAYLPAVGDEVIISTDGLAGTKGVNEYVIPVNAALELTWAAAITTEALGYKLIGETTIQVPGATFYTARINAYKFICVKAQA